MAFSFDSLIPSMGSFSLSSFLKILLYGSIIGGGLGFGIKYIKDRIKYQYFGLIFRRRQSLEEGIPESKVVWGKSGYFTKRSGKSIFRIKYGLMPWQQVELSKLPDPKYMIDKIVAYEQLNKDNLVQCNMKVDWDGGLDIQPVEDDLKYGAMLDIYDKGRTLENKILSPTVIGMMIIGLILVAGIVVYYFLGKA
jgi:hypothetical protein